MIYKWEFFKDKDFIWHLDDNEVELKLIRGNCPNLKGIDVLYGNWKQKCEKLLN